jgi:hypothetical protein
MEGAVLDVDVFEIQSLGHGGLLNLLGGEQLRDEARPDIE